MDDDLNSIVDFEEDDFSESEIRMLEEAEERALVQKAGTKYIAKYVSEMSQSEFPV